VDDEVFDLADDLARFTVDLLVEQLLGASALVQVFGVPGRDVDPRLVAGLVLLVSGLLGICRRGDGQRGGAHGSDAGLAER
jgi:hypothetical protein